MTNQNNGADREVPAKAPLTTDFNDPDAQNSEQSEDGTQAQDVASDARLAALDVSEESEHGGRANPAQIIPDDTPDLVDKLHEMARSGRIDMDAYEGEENMDDEDGT
ncbi:MAG: hypothetical protein ABIQ66_09830 [Novosphingobium sp.]